MADDLTPKQEAFCVAYIETGNAAEAYRRAYDVKAATQHSTIYVKASELLRSGKVSVRVKELQALAVETAIYSKQKAFEEYEAARQLALEKENPSAAVAAVTGKVKLFGLDAPVKQITEHTGKDGGPIQTEDKGAGKLLAYLDAVSSRAAGSASE